MQAQGNPSHFTLSDTEILITDWVYLDFTTRVIDVFLQL